MSNYLYHNPNITCEVCRSNDVYWDQFPLNNELKDKLIYAYFTHQIDFECLSQKSSSCRIEKKQAASILIQTVREYSINQIIDILRERNTNPQISASNIPQFSKIEDGMYNISEILHGSMVEEMSFPYMGKYLRRGIGFKKRGADFKYGENHAKMAALLDLCLINQTSREISESILGSELLLLNKLERKQITTKLFLRVPIIQKYFIMKLNDDELRVEMSNFLAESTTNRRLPNVRKIISEIKNQSDEEVF